MTTLSPSLQPQTIHLEQFSFGSTFHQCVYILCKQLPTLMAAAATSRAAFGEPEAPFTPHLSLLYSDLPQSDRSACHLSGSPVLSCMPDGSIQKPEDAARHPIQELVMPWLGVSLGMASTCNLQKHMSLQTRQNLHVRICSGFT